jgi:hypothetical protein
VPSGSAACGRGAAGVAIARQATMDARRRTSRSPRRTRPGARPPPGEVTSTGPAAARTASTRPGPARVAGRGNRCGMSPAARRRCTIGGTHFPKRNHRRRHAVRDRRPVAAGIARRHAVRQHDVRAAAVSGRLLPQPPETTT